jgi:signal transduction histidine kinase
MGRRVGYDTEKVMAVSYPLRSEQEIVGALRFIASLRDVNRDIRRITFVFIAFGGLVIVISGLVSFFLANSIVSPLKEVTVSAEKMASGDFRFRVAGKRKDMMKSGSFQIH